MSTSQKDDPAGLASYIQHAEPPSNPDDSAIMNGDFAMKRVSSPPIDEVFGDESDADIKYRTMSWWHAALIMIAENISLGILSLPSAMAATGMAPGIIIILGLGAMATYTGYTIGQFKQAYPRVHSMADAGEVLLGPIGREIFGLGQILFIIFLMGSHVLTFTIALNVVTGHPTCTIVWGIVGTVIFFVLTLPRTLKNVSYLSIAAFISVVSAVVITMVALGVSPPDKHVQATTNTTFVTGFGAVLNILFAYAGHVAFFGFISEMKDTRDYPKGLFALQIADISIYLVVAVVIYYYGGPNVASPALGSTGHVVRKVAYGIALPTIIIAGVIFAHVNTKYIFVRMFRGTKHISQRSWIASGSWAGIALALWIVAWIISASIPVFNDLVQLVASLFATWFTLSLPAIFWLFINKGNWFKNTSKMALTIINFMILVLGVAICVIGLYTSGKNIHDDTAAGLGGAWSCADNSHAK